MSCDSQVTVKETEGVSSSAPPWCLLTQLNFESASSFPAENSRVENVLERPEAGSTWTEVWMVTPEHKEEEKSGKGEQKR